MTSHLKKENKFQECFSQELFNTMENCLEKNPYCSSQLIFDNDCTGERELGSPKKELIVDNQTMVTPAPGTCEAQFSIPRTFSILSHEEKPAANSNAQKKRKRPVADPPKNEESDDFKLQVFSMLETSSQVLTAHMESQSANSQLDRNQRKEHAESLMGALGKLTDALGKIAKRL